MIKEINKLECQFKGIYNAHGISQLTALTSLDLSENRLKTIDLSKLARLDTLNLSDNPLDGAAFNNINPALPATLKILNLSNTGLTNQFDLTRYTALTDINLSGNKLLGDASVNTFNQKLNEGLTKLDLSGTAVGATDVTILKRFSGLTELSLNNVKTAAKMLSALDKKLTNHLKKLHLKNAGLIQVASSPLGFEFYTAVTDLNLSANKISEINLSNLTNLVYLDVSGMPLSARSIEQIKKHAATLTYLNLRDTRLTNHINLNAFTALTELDLSENTTLSDLTIATLSERLDNRLERLDLTETGVSNAVQLKRFNALQWLLLYGTSITNDIVATLHPNLEQTLTGLNLGATRITTGVPLTRFSALKALGLAHNRLINNSDIANLNAQLEKLDLEATGITAEVDFARFSKLDCLDINNNNLSHINLKDNAALVELYISGGNNIDPTSLDQLETALPNLAIY